MCITCTMTGSKLALVPAGNCVVGSDAGPENSRPAITVFLDTYYMEILEVTVLDYNAFQLAQRKNKKAATASSLPSVIVERRLRGPALPASESAS